MDTFSMSNSLSKGSVCESDSILKAYRDDAASRLAADGEPAAISNEQIRKGDPILETYRVPTIFSEWMDGGSLKDAIQNGRLYEGTEEEVRARILDIAIQAARGLQYSHERGLIHQDVKPGNILLTADWEAKVADFGLAKAQSQLSDGNAPLSTGYTPAYCPREQAEGAEAAAWMDVYAWALTVIEMYAGKRLWETGAEAADDSRMLLEACRVPKALRALLENCLTGRRADDRTIIETLEKIYRDATGSEYLRSKPTLARETANALNNKALSLLDLGKSEAARLCWEEAIRISPEMPEGQINYRLFLWRQGEWNDEEMARGLSSLERQFQEEEYRVAAAELDMECGLLEEAKELAQSLPNGREKERLIEAIPGIRSRRVEVDASRWGEKTYRLTREDTDALETGRLYVFDKDGFDRWWGKPRGEKG